MKEQLSTSTQNPKIELPNKELVGVKTTKQKEQDLKSESAKLPVPSGWRILVLPFLIPKDFLKAPGCLTAF